MKKICRLLLTSLQWLLLAALGLEVFCFLLMTAANYLLYGQIREGNRAVYDPYALFLDQEGPRPTAHNPGGPAGYTIWMLGGSTMRSDSGEVETTIPSCLAGMLNRPGSPHRCNVLNYGVTSFNSLLETKYLQKLLIEQPKAPDLIIFYDGANDSAYFAQHRTPYGHYGYRRLRAAIEDYHRSFFGLLKPLHAAFYSSYSKETYDKLLEVAVPLEPEQQELQKMAALNEQRYEQVHKLAGCYGARFLLVWQPILYVETAPVAPRIKQEEQHLAIFGERFSQVRHNFAVVYRVLEDKLQDKPYFLNLRNALCPRTQPVYEPDGVHLKAAGNEMVARALARELEKRGLER